MGKITYSPMARRQMNGAMRLSFAIGCVMLLIKCYAYFITGSAAILSDSAESIVHVFAVGFAAYSMWLSHKPADRDHTYGHDRITFFSAGFEGSLIIVAAVFILYQSLQKILCGFELENLEFGMVFIASATVLNGALGFFLIRRGKKFRSIVLEADGRHILTDCMTSLGVLLALVLYAWTGWIYFDPLLAILIAINILYTGVRLLYSAFQGLMDRTDSEQDRSIRELLNRVVSKYKISYHNLRHRDAGNRLMIEVHLLFPNDFSLFKAHELATQIEQEVGSSLDKPTELVTHLEPIEGHDEVHQRLLGYEG